MNTSKMNGVLLWCVAALVCFIVPGELFAQRVLTLEESLNIALKQSNNIINQMNLYQRDSITNLRTLAGQKLSTNLSFTMPQFNTSISEQPSDYGTTISNNKNYQSSGSLQIRQPFRLLNGSFSLNGSYSTTDQFSVKKVPTQYTPAEIAAMGLSKGTILYHQVTRNTETHQWSDRWSLGYSMPLLQPNEQKHTWEKTNRDWEITKLEFAQTENSIWANVLSNFYNLYKAKRNLQISQDNFVMTKASADITENKFKAGLIPEVQVMKLRVDFANAQDTQERNKISYKKQLDNFKRLIGLPVEDEIDITATIEEKDIKFIEIDPKVATDLALKNDVSLKNTEYSMIDQDFSIRLSNARDRVSASLNFSYGLNESEQMDNKWWTGKFDWLNNLLNNFDNTNAITLSLTVPIYDSGIRGYNIQNSKLQRAQSEKNLANSKDNLRQNVLNAIDAVNNAWNRIKLQGNNVEVAEMMNQINEEKYNLGELSADELSNSRNSVVTAKENVLDAQITYVLAVASLYNLTYWDFEHNRPLIESVEGYIKR
jgi:outer membrane protein TolC